MARAVAQESFHGVATERARFGILRDLEHSL